MKGLTLLLKTGIVTVYFSWGPWWFLSSVVFLLLASYVSVCRLVLDVYSRKAVLEQVGQGGQERVERFFDQEDAYISSLRVVDHLLRLGMVLSLAIGRFQVLAPDALSGRAGLVHMLVLALEITAVTVVFLEIGSGIIARIAPETLYLRLVSGVDRLHLFVCPLRRVVNGTVRVVVRGLGGRAVRTNADIIGEEILSAAEEGEREGLFESSDIDMIESIITFGGVEVAAVMTPRTDMVCLDVTESFEANLSRAVKCGHSRLPVFRETKDNIIGILYVKDLLKYWDRRESVQLEEVLRQTHFVPLSKKIDDLLQEFKTERFHIAIVLDEFGGTSGLITIEDVIEEIVGDITDEFEPEEQPAVTKLGPDLFEVDAAVHIDDINEELKIDIPEDEDYETIGGFLFSRMGRIPSKGDTFRYESLSFEVTDAEERRIRRVHIRRVSGDPGVPRSGAVVRE